MWQKMDIKLCMATFDKLNITYSVTPIDGAVDHSTEILL